jgi:hypothetical protein
MSEPDSIPPVIRLQRSKARFYVFMETGNARDLIEARREAQSAADEMARIAYESPAPNLSAQ